MNKPLEPLLVAEYRPNNVPIIYLHCNQCRKRISRLTDKTISIVQERHYFCYEHNPEQTEFKGR